MYNQERTLEEFHAPFTAVFDRSAAPDGRGYGVLLDAQSRLVSMFRTKRHAMAEARDLNRIAKQRRAS